MSSYPINLTDNQCQVIEKFLDVQAQNVHSNARTFKCQVQNIKKNQRTP